jgi:hypothetical protein
MKLCFKCRTYKSFESFSKSKKTKDGLQTKCKECDRAYYLENQAKVLQRVSAHRQENLDHIRKSQKAYYDKNVDVLLEKSRTYRKLNAEPIKSRRAFRYQQNSDVVKSRVSLYRANNMEAFRTRVAAYKKANAHKVNATAARRHAKKLSATPSWANPAKIEAVYAEATRLTRETGIKHHVDHIVPLISKLVCGLHWEVNLQVLTWHENAKKETCTGQTCRRKSTMRT